LFLERYKINSAISCLLAKQKRQFLTKLSGENEFTVDFFFSAKTAA